MESRRRSESCWCGCLWRRRQRVCLTWQAEVGVGVASCVCGLLEARRDSDAEGAAERSRRSRERAGEGERERESDAGGGAQAASDAAGATTRGWGAATLRVLRASTMSLVCARGGGASAAEEQRASAVPTTAEGLGQRTMLRGSDADEPVLRWRRLAWPEARTADRGRGSHFSRSGPETNERIAKGIRTMLACGRGTGRVPKSASAQLRWSTRQRVCVSKLQGIDTTGLMPCACEGKKRLTFDGAQDKECCQRREAERAQNAKEIPERLDFGLSVPVLADSGCST